MDEHTEEREFSWDFYYNSVKLIEPGDFPIAPGGNTPLKLDQTSGNLIDSVAARETGYHVQKYIKNGDPNVENSSFYFRVI